MKWCKICIHCSNVWPYFQNVWTFLYLIRHFVRTVVNCNFRLWSRPMANLQNTTSVSDWLSTGMYYQSPTIISHKTQAFPYIRTCTYIGLLRTSISSLFYRFHSHQKWYYNMLCHVLRIISLCFHGKKWTSSLHWRRRWQMAPEVVLSTMESYSRYFYRSS